MTTIRPDLLPSSGHRPQAQDHGKLAAQRQFFAAALAQAQGAAAPSAPAAAAPAQAVAQAVAAQPTETPQKVLRPGSLIDIRV